jgi:hypothetical protein
VPQRLRTDALILLSIKEGDRFCRITSVAWSARGEFGTRSRVAFDEKSSPPQSLRLELSSSPNGRDVVSLSILQGTSFIYLPSVYALPQ